MMIKKILKPFAAAIMLVAFGFLFSCEDDESTGSSSILLESFGPSGVSYGDDMSLIGRNLDKVTAVILPQGVEIPASSFKSHSKDLIVITVPLEVTFGKVALRTPQGDIESKAIFSPEAPVELTSFDAEAKPGTNMTIQGNFLEFVNEVWFSNGLVVTDFVSQSRTELVVTVPLAAQTGTISLVRGVGIEDLAVESETNLVVTLPGYTSMTPLDVKHTDELTITGTDLDLVTSLVFTGGHIVTDFQSQTESEIVVQVPVGVLNGPIVFKQAAPIDITTDDAISIILPKGTSISPKPAVPGEDDLTITGTNLDLVASLTLPQIGNVPSTDFISHSPTEIVLAFPETGVAGPITYTTIHGYSNNLGVAIAIPTEGPPPLDYYIYDDQLQNSWGNWDGWGWTEKDLASQEQVLQGDNAIKVTFNDQYGALQIGSPSAGVFSGYSMLSFQIYAPAAQDLIVQLNNDSDYYISIPQGWSLVDVPIASLAGNGSVTELRIKNNNGNLPVTLYLDEIGLKF